MGNGKDAIVNIIWGEEKCRKEDIMMRHGATAPLATGVPTYTVEVTNMRRRERGRRMTCGGGCGGGAYREDRQLRKKTEE